MKNLFVTPLVVGGLVVALFPARHALAAPITTTIQDNYIGGTAEYWKNGGPASPVSSSNSWYDKDVIGTNAQYDTTKMKVSFSGSDMLVDIYSNYLNNIGSDSTELGDLFISTSGWSPAGTSADGYYEDNNTGAHPTTDWDYAVVFGQRPTANGGKPTTTSGDADLYSVLDANIVSSYLSSSLTGTYIYRADQDVQYNPGGQKSAASGTWSIHYGTSESDNYLQYEIDYSALGVSPGTELGFHWAMTCANDVIEGEAPVPAPEPATMLLFSAGLFGLAGICLKRKGLGSVRLTT